MVYILEESCVCILLVVMLGSLLYTAVSFALIAREILGNVLRRVYSWAVNSARGELFSMPVSVGRERGGRH